MNTLAENQFLSNTNSPHITQKKSQFNTINYKVARIGSWQELVSCHNLVIKWTADLMDRPLLHKSLKGDEDSGYTKVFPDCSLHKIRHFDCKLLLSL